MYPKSYEFGYSVKDALSGNDYGRRESSDGNVVRGEYRVQLPDGRTQIVTYHADWQTGFHADVRYVGEARYPETLPNYNRGGNTGKDYVEQLLREFTDLRAIIFMGILIATRAVAVE
uniref:Putative cuticle protein n=1 Tax=Bombyx mori TaxID=7091 RepID=C0H6Y4_BOMMO|nr:TPA: putative cuticle protein [Bombyx mori]